MAPQTEDVESENLFELIGTIDTKALIRAGELHLRTVSENVPDTVEGYLLAVKHLMCKIKKEQDLLDPKDPQYRFKLNRAFKKDLEPIKTTEPNETWLWMWENRLDLQDILDPSVNSRLTYFGIVQLEQTYLLRSSANSPILELPHFLFLRVACALHFPNFSQVHQHYMDMINLKSIPASPTLFNAGLTISQMSSCFLLVMGDSLLSIEHKKFCMSLISKYNGASGFSVSDLRSGSAIGHNGIADGILPNLIVVDKSILYVNQHGHRPGAAQGCLAIWHVDIHRHIEATKKTGNVAHRVAKLDTSIGCYDLFFDRVDKDENWSLFDPAQFFDANHEPMLGSIFGKEFEKMYTDAEKAGKARKTVSARALLDLIGEVAMESGRPFMINLDAINRKSNMKNVGPVKSLNLCQEIALPADEERIPSCNLGSICLRMLVDPITKKFDWKELGRLSEEQVINLNAVIDRNFYPLPEIEFANRETRPIGIGFQGAIDAILQMDMIYDSPEADRWMEMVVACASFNALKKSCDLAEKDGPYSRFEGSPYSQGKYQFDLWNDEAREKGLPEREIIEPAEWGQIEESWDQLRAMIIKIGLRNSQILTSQPTSSVSTITGNGEAWEAFYTNIFTRRTQNGSYLQVNAYLQKDLEDLGLWNGDTVDWIRGQSGSIQGLTEMVDTVDPKIIARLQYLERKHRTIFEYSKKVIIRQAAIRGHYIDGSQSTNLHFAKSEVEQFTAAIVYANKMRNKTLAYFTRTLPAQDAIKFTVSKSEGKLKIQRNMSVERTASDQEAAMCYKGVDCASCQ
jgi:ribonucleoside-diphosphate reductase alpha subunit